MLTALEAKTMVDQKYKSFPVCSLLDLGDSWAVILNTGDPPVPGTPVVLVNKESAASHYLPIPPFSNLDLLDSGKPVPRKEWDPDFVE